MDGWKRAATALVVAFVTLGAASDCAQWRAENAAERGIPFGVGDVEGHVAARSGLNLRTEPSTNAQVLATLENGLALRITCMAEGENIDGNSAWYQVGTRKWVSAEYVVIDGAPPNLCD